MPTRAAPPFSPADACRLPLAPMIPTRVRYLPPSGDWHWEVKYDGYRLLAATKSPRNAASLRTRNGADATRWFPEVNAALQPIAGQLHVLDGEAAVLDDIGRSDFLRLHARARRRCWYPGADVVVFCAFDLLVHAGKDIRDLPLEARRARLRALLSPCDGVLFVQSVDDPAWLWQQVLAFGLEGMVGKRAGSRYGAGLSADWVKLLRAGAKPGGFRRAAP